MEFKNQLFPNMLRAALNRLESRSPDEISRLGNLPFDGNAFHFHSFGKAWHIAARRIKTALSFVGRCSPAFQCRPLRRVLFYAKLSDLAQDLVCR